jgi:hypothetical protein
MNGKSLWKYVPPAGPILSLLLIGLVLLSALIYYRAVKIQRFLEPALALSQPRNEFTKSINQKFQKEFGTAPIRGLTFKSGSLLMEKSLLFSRDGKLTPSAHADLQKLARVYLALMEDDHLRSEINLVLIIGRVPSHGAKGTNVAEWAHVGRTVGFIQDALFQLEPELGRRFSTSFASVVQPASPHEGSMDTVEFRIIPSEFLHIEVLEKLEKYFH